MHSGYKHLLSDALDAFYEFILFSMLCISTYYVIPHVISSLSHELSRSVCELCVFYVWFNFQIYSK